MARRKRTITLTDWELREVINCMESAYAYGLAYGQPGTRGEELAPANRRRLIDKLTRLEESEA